VDQRPVPDEGWCGMLGVAKVKVRVLNCMPVGTGMFTYESDRPARKRREGELLLSSLSQFSFLLVVPA
jgi:hypothetical protein